MIELPTPKTKWYVTEYPEECSFAITDGNEILVTIIGGNTIGDQCDLASRIAKLPDLERERDEARQEWGKASMDAAQLLSEKTKVIAERDEAREALMEIEDRCVDCEDACGDIQKIRDIAVKALEEPK